MGNNSIKRVGLFGPYGFGNMGDAALVDAAIAGFKRHIPDVELCGICQHPENAELMHAIPMHSIYRIYPRLAKPAKPNGQPGSGQGSGQQDSNQSSQQAGSHNKPNKPGSPPPSLKNKIKQVLKANPATHQSAKLARTGFRKLEQMLAELKFMVGIYKTVKNLDLIAMPGSGQLNEEWGGPWRYPYSLFRWCLIARLAGCKIAFLSVGAGTVESAWGRFFCRSALRLAQYKSFRDENTRQVVEGLGVYDGVVVPDLAFSLALNEEQPQAELERSKPVVGINAISYCDPRSWYEKDQRRYDEYIAKLAGFCGWLIESGYRIHFVPNEIRMDNWVIDDVLASMGRPQQGDEDLVRPETLSYRDVYQNLSQCDYVIASRFHGLLFSFLSCTPIITLAFHFKLSALAKALGQQEYTLDIGQFQQAQLQQCFERLVHNADSVKATIADRVAPYPQRVDAQFMAVSQL